MAEGLGDEVPQENLDDFGGGHGGFVVGKGGKTKDEGLPVGLDFSGLSEEMERRKGFSAEADLVAFFEGLDLGMKQAGTCGVGEAIGKGLKEGRVLFKEGVTKFKDPRFQDEFGFGEVLAADGRDGPHDPLGGFHFAGGGGGEFADHREELFGVITEAAAKLHDRATTEVSESDGHLSKAEFSDKGVNFFTLEKKELIEGERRGFALGEGRDAIFEGLSDDLDDFGGRGGDLRRDTGGDLRREGLQDPLDGGTRERLKDHGDGAGREVLKKIGLPRGIEVIERRTAGVCDEALEFLNELRKKLFAGGFGQFSADGRQGLGLLFREKAEKSKILVAA